MDVKAIDGIALARSATASSRSVSSAAAGAGADTAASTLVSSRMVSSGAASADAAPAAGTPQNSSGFVYISPIVRYDQAARLAVLFYRDADTGETRDQIPTEQVVEEHRRANLDPPVTSESVSTGQAGGTGRTATGIGGDSADAATSGFSTLGNSSGNRSAAALYQAAAALVGQGTGGGMTAGGGPSMGTAAFGGAAGLPAGGSLSGGRVSVTV